nr:hypothetical protein [Bacilli bacterium]
MRKALLLVSSLFILGACATPGPKASSQIQESSEVSTSEINTSSETSVSLESSSEEETSEEETSEETTSIETSSSEESIEESSSSSEEISTSIEQSSGDLPVISSSIKVARDAAKALTVPENSAGIRIGEQAYKLTGVVLSVSDLVATTKEYASSGRYKALLADETGYIHISLSDAFYQKVKDYTGQSTSVYSVTGVIATYRDNPELIVSDFTFLSGQTLVIDIFQFAEAKSS